MTLQSIRLRGEKEKRRGREERKCVTLLLMMMMMMVVTCVLFFKHVSGVTVGESEEKYRRQEERDKNGVNRRRLEKRPEQRRGKKFSKK